MSTGAEQELRQRLSAVLDEMTPGPAPVGAVIRRGRGVRRRRAAGAAAGVLVAAAAVAGFGWLGLRLPSQAPVTPGPPVITVVPPGPGAPAGLVASGRVGATTWSVRVSESTAKQVCLLAGRAGQSCSAVTRPVGPVDLNASGGTSSYFVLAGLVQPKVTRVDVLLADGQRLVLHPVLIHGRHWVAAALPIGTRATRATAYAGRSVYRYTIPFSAPGSVTAPTFATWLRPGTAGLSRGVFPIASGTAAGHRWWVTEYSGPWGRCFVVTGASDCYDGGGALIQGRRLTQPMFQVPDSLHLAAAAPGVTSLRLDLASGGHLRVATRAGYGGQLFYAFVLPHGTGVVGWTAYGADGKVLGSGPGATAG
jgi:hypothetical protein